MRFTKEDLYKLNFTNKEAINLIWVLCQKLENEPIDLAKAAPTVVGFIEVTFGTSYDDLHPTEESKKVESYSDWIQKRLGRSK